MHYPLRSSFGVPDLHVGNAEPSAPLTRIRLVSPIDRWCLSKLVQVVGDVPVQFVLWDGTTARAGDGLPRFTVHLASRGALWRLACDPDLGFGEGYVDGDLRVDGDMPELVDAVAGAVAARGWQMGRVHRWLAHGSGAGILAARRNARASAATDRSA